MSPAPSPASTAGEPRDTDEPRDASPLVPPEASDAETAPAVSPALTPASAEEIPALREEIDTIDTELLRLVRRRSEISQRIGLARMAAGGPRIVYNREMQVLARFRDLGGEGRELAMLLLRLGRGRLGGR